MPDLGDGYVRPLDVKELESTLMDLGSLLADQNGSDPEIECIEDPDSHALRFVFRWDTTLSFYLTPGRREELDLMEIDEVKAVLYDQYESSHRDLSSFLRGWADKIDQYGIKVRKARHPGRG